MFGTLVTVDEPERVRVKMTEELTRDDVTVLSDQGEVPEIVGGGHGRFGDRA